jgi:hypothetical protein
MMDQLRGVMRRQNLLSQAAAVMREQMKFLTKSTP